MPCMPAARVSVVCANMCVMLHASACRGVIDLPLLVIPIFATPHSDFLTLATVASTSLLQL
jgi:hypothetical protein